MAGPAVPSRPTTFPAPSPLSPTSSRRRTNPARRVGLLPHGEFAHTISLDTQGFGVAAGLGRLSSSWLVVGLFQRSRRGFLTSHTDWAAEFGSSFPPSIPVKYNLCHLVCERLAATLPLLLMLMLLAAGHSRPAPPPFGVHGSRRRHHLHRTPLLPPYCSTSVQSAWGPRCQYTSRLAASDPLHLQGLEVEGQVEAEVEGQASRR